MKIRDIERLRAVAALLVLYCHLPAGFGRFPAQGAASVGMELFFVISGFVVSRSLLAAFERSPRGRGPETRRFLSRRLFRVLPAALAWCVIPLLLAWATRADYGWPGLAREIGLIFTLRYNYVLPAHLEFDLAYFWSINVEEHFYLALPLFLLLVRGRLARVATSLALAVAVTVFFHPWDMARIGVPFAERYLHYTTHNRFDALFAGVWLALLEGTGWSRRALSRVSPGWGRIAGVLGLAWLLIAFAAVPTAGPYLLNSAASWLIAAGLVWLGSADRELILPWRGLRPALEWAGSRSYSIYLAHPIAIKLVLAQMGWPDEREATGPNGLGLLWVFLLTFAFAELSYRLFERPGMALGSRLARKT